MKYKEIVKQLLSIDWSKIQTEKQLTELMFLSLVTAIEFQGSLRIARDLYPANKNLREMADGELQTNNLIFSDYNYVGDHWEFLQHFLNKAGVIKEGWKVQDELSNISEDVYRSALKYSICIFADMSYEDRAMSIFSREEELSKIFSDMLEKIPVFKSKKLPEHLRAYKYYLERHIALDSEVGGHQDLVKEFKITDEVSHFYELRLNLYLNAFPILNVVIV